MKLGWLGRPLAKAFHGPKAEPAPQSQYDEKGNLASPSGQSGTKYPDQVYLLALDREGDGKVSWHEFDSFGEAYAAQLKNMQRLKQQALRAAYAQAQRNLARSSRPTLPIAGDVAGSARWVIPRSDCLKNAEGVRCNNR